MIKRLPALVHLLVHLKVQLVVAGMHPGLRLEGIPGMGHGLDGSREVGVDARADGSIDGRAQTGCLVNVRTRSR